MCEVKRHSTPLLNLRKHAKDTFRPLASLSWHAILERSILKANFVVLRLQRSDAELFFLSRTGFSTICLKGKSTKSCRKDSLPIIYLQPQSQAVILTYFAADVKRWLRNKWQIVYIVFWFQIYVNLYTYLIKEENCFLTDQSTHSRNLWV